jgi:2Fe-2S ferredoxin
MAKIEFQKKISSIRLHKPTNLMQALQQNNVPVASSCGGEAVCGKCAVKVLSGDFNLSSKKQKEKECLAQHAIYDSKMRLSCQCIVMGDVKVDTDYW